MQNNFNKIAVSGARWTGRAYHTKMIEWRTFVALCLDERKIFTVAAERERNFEAIWALTIERLMNSRLTSFWCKRRREKGRLRGRKSGGYGEPLDWVISNYLYHVTFVEGWLLRFFVQRFKYLAYVDAPFQNQPGEIVNDTISNCSRVFVDFLS